MTASVAPVLVAGAGPSGLVVALTLLQNGVPVRIIDKDPQYRVGQRGHGLWPRTFEVFHFLGVPEIHERGTPVLTIREYKPGTLEPVKDFKMFSYNEPTPSIPYNNPRLLGQSVLEAILRTHLERHGCTVEMATELQAFEQSDDHVVAKLVKRSSGEEVSETFTASYLIGADGARGVSRKQLGLSFLGETRDDITSVVGDICLEVEGLDREHWHFLGSRASNFLMFRPTDEIGPDGFHFLLATKDHDPDELVADEKLLFQCISELMGREINVRKVVCMSVYRPNIRMVDKFGSGRVFIAGDAAHVHSPTGGQGLNTCAQDALNLAWKLSLVYKGLSSPTLLDSYNLERLPVVAEMLNITTETMVQIREAPGIDGAMQREKKMNMLGINYRSSPIVIDDITTAEPVNAYKALDESVLVAGDRAPDAPGLIVVKPEGEPECAAMRLRLFDVFKPNYHTVLVFGSNVVSAEEVIGAVSSYPRDVSRSIIVLPRDSVVTEKLASEAAAEVVVDAAGHAYRAYLAASGELKVVVVRPDGVIGAIVRGAEGLKTYFEKIFV